MLPGETGVRFVALAIMSDLESSMRHMEEKFECSFSIPDASMGDGATAIEQRYTRQDYLPR
jgi:hypothetical protein